MAFYWRWSLVPAGNNKTKLKGGTKLFWPVTATGLLIRDLYRIAGKLMTGFGKDKYYLIKFW